MSITVVEADIWTPSVESVADGEAVSQVNELLAPQGLADRTRFIYNRLPNASGGKYPIPLIALANSNSRFTYVIPDSDPKPAHVWRQTSVADAGHLVFAVPFLKGARFSSVIIQLQGHDGDGGSHAALPATMPEASLWSFGDDHVGGTQVQTLIDNQVDLSPNVGVYDVNHQIEMVFTQETFSSERHYAITFDGEAGANAEASAVHLLSISLILDA